MSTMFLSKWPGLIWSGTSANRPNGTMSVAKNAWIDAAGRLSGRPGLKTVTFEPAGTVNIDYLDPRALRPMGETNVNTKYKNALISFCRARDYDNQNYPAFMGWSHYYLVGYSIALDPETPLNTTGIASGIDCYPVGQGESFDPIQDSENPPGLAEEGEYVLANFCREVVFGLRAQYTDTSKIETLPESWQWGGFGVPYCVVPVSQSVGIVPSGTGFLADQKRTAYVACIVYTINGVEWIGPASVPYVIENNSGGTADVSLRWQVLPEAYNRNQNTFYATATFNPLYQYFTPKMRIYRSVIQTDITAAGHASDYRLVYEADILTDAQKYSGGGGDDYVYIEFTDIVPDAGDYGGLMGETCYVSENTGEGFAQRNEWAPGCVTTESYQSIRFYGNVWERQQISMSLLSNFNDGDTVTIDVSDPTISGPINTAVFTARNAPGSPGEFQIFTSGTTTQNIKNTMLAFAQAINQSQYIGLLAEPVGNSEGQPIDVGRIFMYSLNPRMTMAITPSVSSSVLKVTITGGAYQPNRIAYSKPGAAWAVPSVNYFEIGDSSTYIWALKANNSSLYCFTNEGIYKINLDSAGPYVELFDRTVKVDGPRCVDRSGDILYVYARHQIVAVTDGGARSISENIRPYLEDFAQKNGPSHQTGVLSYVTAIQEQRKVVIALQSVQFYEGEGQHWSRVVGNKILIYDEDIGVFTTSEEVKDLNVGAAVDMCTQDKRTWHFLRASDVASNRESMVVNILYWMQSLRQEYFGDFEVREGGGNPTDSKSYTVDIAFSKLTAADSVLSFFKEAQIHFYYNIYDPVKYSVPEPGININAYFYTDYLVSSASGYQNLNVSMVVRINVPQTIAKTPRLQMGFSFDVDGEKGSQVVEGVSVIYDEISQRTRT